MQFKPKHIQEQLTLPQNSNIHLLPCIFEDLVVTLKRRSELVPKQKLLNRTLLPYPCFIIELFVHSYIQSTNTHWASTTCLCIILGHTVLETNINTTREPEYWPMRAQRGSPQHFLETWRISGKKHLEMGSLGREGGEVHTHQKIDACKNPEVWKVESVWNLGQKCKWEKYICAHPTFWSIFTFILLYLTGRKRQGKRRAGVKAGGTKYWQKRAINRMNSISEGRFSHCKKSLSIFTRFPVYEFLHVHTVVSLFLVGPTHRQAWQKVLTV